VIFSITAKTITRGKSGQSFSGVDTTCSNYPLAEPEALGRELLEAAVRGRWCDPGL